jgi:hypothetical protein
MEKRKATRIDLADRNQSSAEVWKEVTPLLRYEKLEWKCNNNSKGQEEPSPVTG